MLVAFVAVALLSVAEGQKWNNWGKWGACYSAFYSRYRTRSCRTTNYNVYTYRCGNVYAIPTQSSSCRNVAQMWGSWANWSNSCPTCASGTGLTGTCTSRYRQCSVGTYSVKCGNSNTGRVQNIVCPHKYKWGNWNNWSNCYGSCGGKSTLNRYRYCKFGNSYAYTYRCGNALTRASRACTVSAVWNKWNSWSSSCSTYYGTRLRYHYCRCYSSTNVNGGCGNDRTGNVASVCCGTGCTSFKWLKWNNWSSCYVYSTLRYRYRSCDMGNKTLLYANHCGKSTLSPRLSAPCNPNASWNGWGNWSTCYGCAANSNRYRLRNCKSGYSNICGSSNNGRYMTSRCTRDCSKFKWAGWNNWSSCRGYTCTSNASIYRYRSCRDGTLYDATACGNLKSQYRTCKPSCMWNRWNNWSNYCYPCGANAKTSRYRYCNGLYYSSSNSCGNATGTRYQTGKCTRPCTIYWGKWGAWGACSSSCSNSNAALYRMRIRPCRTKTTGNYTTSASVCGNSYRTQNSNCYKHCSASYKWTAWNNWGRCYSYASCGASSGRSTRYRYCRGSNGSYSATGCGNLKSVSRTCSTACFNNWTNWTKCSASCMTGNYYSYYYAPKLSRKRTCKDTKSTYACGYSSKIQNRLCNTKFCSSGKWAAWNNWSKYCYVSYTLMSTCTRGNALRVSNGNRYRYRGCKTGNTTVNYGGPCGNQRSQLGKCSRGCWNNWSAWGTCVRNHATGCSYGNKLRTRKCRTGASTTCGAYSNTSYNTRRTVSCYDCKPTMKPTIATTKKPTVKKPASKKKKNKKKATTSAPKPTMKLVKKGDACPQLKCCTFKNGCGKGTCVAGKVKKINNSCKKPAGFKCTKWCKTKKTKAPKKKKKTKKNKKKN